MAFQPGGGIDPGTISVPVPPGTKDRGGLSAPFVPSKLGETPTTGTSRPVLGPEAGLFGGTMPPSRKGSEKRMQRLGDKQRFETFHPIARQRGPFVLPVQGVGAGEINRLPEHAAAVFLAMADGTLR